MDITSVSPFVSTLLKKRIACDFNRLRSVRKVEQGLSNDSQLAHLLNSDAQLVADTRQRALEEFQYEVHPRLAGIDHSVAIESMTECGDPHTSGITLRIGLSDGSTWYRKGAVSKIERDLCHAYDIVSLPSPFRGWPTIHTERSTWQKAVDHAWSTDLESYFFNYGAMVAIMSFMHVSDLHHENLICNGHFPVPVDCEVVNLGFIHSPTVRNDAQRLVDGIIASFPTSTGMVPLNHSATLFGPGISPLESDVNESVFPYFDDVQQRFMLNVETTSAITHLPVAKTQLSQTASREYANSILRGFDLASARLVRHGRELKESLFHEDNTQRRALIRHTTGYSALISQAFCHAPDDPNSAIADTIFRTSKHLSPEVKTQEIECLRDGRIPRFTVDVVDGSLWEATTNVREPVIAEALGAHRHLWAQPQNFQYWRSSSRDLLSYCLGLTTLSNALPGSTRLRNEYVDNLAMIQPAQERLIRHIEGDRISSFRDKSHAWISVTVDSEEAVAVSAIPDDMYFGSAGVIKALRRTTKLTREDSEEYYAQLNQALQNHLDDPAHHVGYYKGVLGIGSELKRLAPLANQRFPEHEFLELVIAESLDSIGTSQHCLDMLMGAPGVIYALAGNSDCTLVPLVNALVEMILDHDGSELVNQKFLVDNVSFAHGASGVIAALAQYAHLNSSGPRLETAVSKLLDLERELGRGSLNDSRYGDDIDSLQWCNGSGGALISRALLAESPLRAVKDHVESDIASHLPNLIAHGNSLGNDCVCHGVAGSVLILEFLQARLPAYRQQLIDATAAFRRELAGQVATSGALNATGMSQHSKGLLVGAGGILCALKPNNSAGIITPEW